MSEQGSKVELFPEFWAGFGKRMEAAGEPVHVIACTAWHAAKAGSDSEIATLKARIAQMEKEGEG